MVELKTYKFSDLYEMSSGISSSPEQAGHGAPFLSFSTVFNNYVLPESLEDKMDTSDKEQEVYSIRAGDIFLTRTSETLDELGMSCVAIKDYPLATYSGFLKRLRPTQSNITYPKFMAFYLRSNLFRKTMSNNAIMTLRASLNEQIFSYLDLLLPPFELQKSIGDILYQTLEKQEVNKRINKELEAMAKLIYDYWFVQFDFPYSPPSEGSPQEGVGIGKPYKSSGGAMVYNEQLKREIPEGWGVKELGEFGQIIGGSTPSKADKTNFSSNGIPWITPKDLSINAGKKYITKGEVDISDSGLKSASLRIMPKGTVLMSSRAPIGYLAIARQNVTTNQGFKSFIPNKGYSSEFLFHTLQRAMPLIEANASGSTFREVSTGILKKLNWPNPPPELVSNYTNRISAVFKQQDILEQENQKLSELRDWLLPMLMNGQVSIKDAQEYVQNHDISMAAEEGGGYGVS